ncbi:MAG: thioredoxin family protein [Saprospiraceae bacterium]|jgi:peroxiredoxin|nr:thioredoxin family protein [Saprospiraceae bacterium]MBP9208750.1 thioredoxin family protein [Saprospiraceae bacterium]MBV6472311.1 hypothetical protein [Saprospiraceae bacterium]
MAATPSNMLALGTRAPDFRLPDVVSGRILHFDELSGFEAYLIVFMCNHCPYVVHVLDELLRIAAEYQPRGLCTLGISANDVSSYPQDGPAEMKALATERRFPFPYLYDETQELARAYDAACTPDFYLFDAERKLVYRGRLDESRPGSGLPVTGHDLRNAIEAILSGQAPDAVQYPSIGCNIKWK